MFIILVSSLLGLCFPAWVPTKGYGSYTWGLEAAFSPWSLRPNSGNSFLVFLALGNFPSFVVSTFCDS